jgi:hypothetical protein
MRLAQYHPAAHTYPYKINDGLLSREWWIHCPRFIHRRRIHELWMCAYAVGQQTA